MTLYPYTFEAPVERFSVGKTKTIRYRVMFLPADLHAALPFDAHPRLRVEGEIADAPIANAFIPSGDGRVYVIVSPTVMKAAGLAVGDLAEMRFRIADQEHVDVPAALARAVNVARDRAEAWGALTPGKRRMLAHHVGSAKTEQTRARRTDEAIDALMNWRGDLHARTKARR